MKQAITDALQAGDQPRAISALSRLIESDAYRGNPRDFEDVISDALVRCSDKGYDYAFEALMPFVINARQRRIDAYQEPLRYALNTASHQGYDEIVNDCLDLVLKKGCQSIFSQDDLCKGLIRSVARKDLVLMERFIKAGADINHVTANGYSVLRHLCRYDYSQFSGRALIEAKEGDFRFLKYLLDKKGLDVNIKDRNGRPVFFDLIGNRYLYSGVLKLLVKKGLNLDAQDAQGRNALHMASSLGNKLMLKLFIKAMKLSNVFDIEAKTAQGRTAIQLAYQYRQYSMVEYLIHRFKLNFEVNETPLGTQQLSGPSRPVMNPPSDDSSRPSSPLKRSLDEVSAS